MHVALCILQFLNWEPLVEIDKDFLFLCSKIDPNCLWNWQDYVNNLRKLNSTTHRNRYFACTVPSGSTRQEAAGLRSWSDFWLTEAISALILKRNRTEPSRSKIITSTGLLSFPTGILANHKLRNLLWTPREMFPAAAAADRREIGSRHEGHFGKSRKWISDIMRIWG